MEKLKIGFALKTILVTSTRAYANGSSFAADLAASIAHAGQRVALVDADYRRPQIHQIYKLSNSAGLMEYIYGECELSDILHSVNSNHLFVLTAGVSKNGKKNPFASREMTGFLDRLKSEHDRVIIQGAPFAFEETLSLAEFMDGVILLIQPNHARSDATRALMRQYQKCGARIIGVVLRDLPKYQDHQSIFIDQLLTYDRQARMAR